MHKLRLKNIKTVSWWLLIVDAFKGFLHLTHFTHCLWYGLRSDAINASAGYTGILQTGHLGTAVVGGAHGMVDNCFF